MAQDLLREIQETREMAKRTMEECNMETPKNVIDKEELEYFLDYESFEVFYYKGMLCLAIISTGTLHPLVLNSLGKYVPGEKIATFTVEEYEPSHKTVYSMIDNCEVGIIN